MSKARNSIENDYQEAQSLHSETIAEMGSLANIDSAIRSHIAKYGTRSIPNSPLSKALNDIPDAYRLAQERLIKHKATTDALYAAMAYIDANTE